MKFIKKNLIMQFIKHCAKIFLEKKSGKFANPD